MYFDSFLCTHYIESEIAARSGTTLISVSNFSVKQQADLIDYYINFAHADGIITIEPAGKLKSNYDVPIVQIALNGDTGSVHSITMDIEEALDEALLLLKKNGHKRLGLSVKVIRKTNRNILKDTCIKTI